MSPVLPEHSCTAYWRRSVRLSPARSSDILLIRITPSDTGLFRYLLEGSGNHLAMLTVLEPERALFKLVFSPHQRGELLDALEQICRTVSFEILRLPPSVHPDID